MLPLVLPRVRGRPAPDPRLPPFPRQARPLSYLTTAPRRTLKQYLGVTWRGFVMGAADVIPGVSGGTMAFILGIYDELIDAIRAAIPFLGLAVRLRFREAFAVLPWRFLLALLVGIGTAILSLAKFLGWALETHPSLVFALFFGLIVASVHVVRNHVRKWTALTVGVVAVAAVLTYVFVGLTPTETPNGLWFIFLSAAIAICAMILPGISGAFVLVLLGKYEYVLGALVAFDVPVIAVFIAGAATGIIAFSNVLRWLLDHYHDITVAVLVGFMIGALRKVWPWKEAPGADGIVVGDPNILPAAFTTDVALALVLAVVGAVAVLLLEWAGARRGDEAPRA